MSSATRRGPASPTGDGPAALRRGPSGFASVSLLIAAQSRRTPDAVAVTGDGRSLTYAELDRRANSLARRLRALGVGPDARVAVSLGRSPDLLVGLLAVLKAGAAYVPLDPDFPAQRLAQMMEDARPAVLLTESRLGGRLPLGDATEVRIDREGEGASPRVALAAPRAEDLAYIIYTSGSTGRPKGVMVTHGGLTNLLLSMRRMTGIGPRDAILAVTTLSFDIAALELYLPLLAGGCVELASREQAADGAWLSARLARGDISFLQATPATWHLLLESGWEGASNLAMLCGGEALTRDLADRLLPRGRVLWNVYGPTETTIWSTAAEVRPGPGPITIGKAVANTRLYVLDAHLQPVPIGVSGELYIGGAGVARGYLDRPALTAERFVPDPFGPPDSRMYRTGDLARWASSGELECLGRVDHQVKIRGFRIELGEVEAALERLPSVRRAAAAAWPDATGEHALIAYVVPEPDRPLSSAPEWREALRATLPDYMVPSTFVPLGELPLTPNGKIDRKRLPAPDAIVRDSQVEYVAPRTPDEEVIARIWADVLGLERVGVREDFFSLGGHSLLATQVVSRLRHAFGAEVPVRLLFEAPTVAALAGRIALERASRPGRLAPAIGPATRSGPPPLSFAQQALWYLDQVAPGRPTFNVVAAARVVGDLDVAATVRAFQEMVRRHESLRTTFATVDGRPVQIIAPSLKIPLALIDLTDLPRDERRAEAERLATEEARRPFDLARGPLVRGTLVRLDERECAIILAMHHIVTDGWSFGIAAGELAALYEAFRRGEPSPLPEPAIQYADFAAWQREWLRGDVLDDLLGYWKGRLSGVPALELPADFPRPAVRSTRGASLGFSLPTDLSRRVVALGRAEGATPFMTLLAAFQALLGRYSGQDVFAVGTPIANRNRHEVEGLIGYFVNMLALRADLAGDPTFREFLGRVRDDALGAYEHQELPLELLLESLRPARDSSRTPLFQVMFILQNNQMPRVQHAGLQLESLGGGSTGTAKFELTLTMAETPDGFEGALEYCTDLFSEGTARRLLDHFRNLLNAIADGPDRRLSELDILGPEERRRLTVEWVQAPDVTPGPSLCVHELFEAQVRRSPDAIAIVSGPHRPTYDALNRRANRFAHRLRALGVGPEVPVGVLASETADLVAGVLAVLKAGGAYVPLDPASPPARLERMVQDSGIGVLLASGLAPRFEGAVVRMDGPEREAEPDADLGPAATPQNLAYVLFTSGSTGTPKGALITHRSLAHAYFAWEEAYELRSETTCHLQVASPGFDVFTGEWVRALLSGATLVACPRETLLDPASLHDLMRRERVDCAEFVPAVAENLIAYLESAGLTLEAMRLLVVGSDQWHAGQHERLRRLCGDKARVVNSYGLTEATIDSAFFEGSLAGQAPGRPAPIGRPFPGTRLYVLDRDLRPQPVGVPGELFVGGPGLARGYLKRPGLTAERFLPDPFGGETGGRLYRTGDRALWLADGALEVLGRADRQVKIRGFRIEPAEVEAALLQCPGVHEAAVEARDDGAGNKTLVAFVVGPGGGVPQVESLRRSLRDRLARPMIPSAFVVLPSLPRTPSGKVDYAALPPFVATVADNEAARVAPRDEVESRLVAIWRDVLGVRTVGVRDDFFDLGGHSLLAVRLAARIEEVFGRKLPLSAFLLGSTIEGLAATLREPEANRGAANLILPLNAGGPGRRLHLIHPIGGGVLCYADLARGFEGRRPVSGVQAIGYEGGEPAESDLESMAARYVAAIRAEQPEGPYHLAGWSFGGVLAFAMAGQLREAEQEVATLALIDTRAPSAGSAIPEERESLAAFAFDLARVAGRELDLPAALTRAGGPQTPEAWLERLDPGLLAELGADRLRALWSVFRANHVALAGYTPRRSAGSILLYHAGDRRDDLGWGRLAEGGVTSHPLGGDHYSVVRGATAARLAAMLESALSKHDS